MNINIKTKVLNDLLYATYKIAYSSDFRNNIFIVEVTENEISITSNNNIISIEKKSNDLEIIETGKFVVNAHIMNELCQKFDGITNIKTSDQNIIHFISGKSKNRVNALDIKMFRKPNFEINGQEILLPKDTFKKIIKQVSFAVQGKDGRTAFKGINLRVFNNKLIATATDGSRIARKILLENINKEIDVILPVMFFSEIFRLCTKNLEKKIFFTKDQVLVCIDENTKILTKTFNEIFPNTETQLKQSIEAEIECNCKDIIKAIERIDVINEKDEIPSIVLKVKDNKFFLSSTNDNQVGYSEEEIEKTKIKGHFKDTVLQVKYLINALRGFDKNDIVIKFSEKNGPVFVQMKNDETVINLILPFWSY